MNVVRTSGIGFGLALFAGAMAFAPATAAMKTQTAAFNSALACQLSLPTIDTKVAPRATGFRNDGTSGTFVICGVALPTDDSFLTGGSLRFRSFDSVSHAFDCTAVTGQPGQTTYKTKTIALPANATATLAFTTSDYGAGLTDLPNGFSLSITCSLPPHVAITMLQATYPQGIGG